MGAEMYDSPSEPNDDTRSLVGAAASVVAPYNERVAPEEWGLDPLWTAHAAVFARDVVSPTLRSDLPGVIKCGTRNVHQVMITGIVVKSDLRAAQIEFQVDDGSAVLSCLWWRSDIIDAARDVETCMGLVELGYTVTVWGRITSYRGQSQLTVSQVRHEMDVHFDVNG